MISSLWPSQGSVGSRIYARMNDMSIKEHPPLHVPVLLESVLQLLDPKLGENYLDLTAGYGGHADAILGITTNYAESVLVDRDECAIRTLERFSTQGARLVHTDFLAAARQLVSQGTQFSLILIDLGVSSPQLDIASRGFSFTHDGPLDMRMDHRNQLTAERLVNTLRRDELVRIISEYGEEPAGVARRYVDAIISARPLHTTGELRDVILGAHVGRWQRTHPATRTFQGLRIAVNDELRQVEQVLPLMTQLLRPGGRVGVISFHSLEDRMVKRYFAEQSQAGYEAELQILTRKPIDGATYDVHNPRARSAKLRVAVKK